MVSPSLKSAINTQHLLKLIHFDKSQGKLTASHPVMLANNCCRYITVNCGVCHLALMVRIELHKDLQYKINVYKYNT